MDITLVKRIYDKMYVDEEEIPLPEGFQGVQDIDCLIFIRLVEENSRSTRLAQFMLYHLKIRRKGLTKALYRNAKPGRALWTCIVSLRKTIKK